MASLFQSNEDAWGSDYFNGNHSSQRSYDSDKAKYFNSDGTLKAGYEQREQSNDSTSMGAVATYSNESSGDDYGDTTFQHYGIYKTPQQAAAPGSTPAPTPAATPAPKPQPTGPVKVSPEIQQAQERTNKYQSDLKDGSASENIYKPNDYAKDTYINPGSSSSNQYDFSKKTFAGDVKDKQTNSQDFFNKKKDQLTTSSKFTEFMQ
tara:strand:+ start:433 stop:1050 length:618 start_codon:yes stop_codon:yes gene_type:complete